MTNFELFTARKIQFDRDKSDKKVSRPAVRIATLGVTLGLAVMIIAVSVVVGFKTEIRNKVVGFGSHIQVTFLDTNTTFETSPISVDDETLSSLMNLSEIRHVQRFATKPGIIKTDDQFEGIVLKGIDPGFDWTFFQSNLVEGEILELSDTVVSNGAIISQTLANRLMLNLGDDFLAYFIEDRIRVRRFTITGIYNTGLGQHDRLFVLTDIQHVQRLNNWDPDQVTGIAISIHDFNRLYEAEDQVFGLIGNRFDRHGAVFHIQTIRDINPQIFGWLDLLDMNVWVILILMVAVAGFNMISGLLIIILEKTNMIGILKALGATDWSIRKIFLYQSVFIVGKGMILGNIIGISLCLIQYFTGIIELDQRYYYLSEVPIYLNLWLLLLLNAGSFVASMLMLVGPSYLISKITPAKSIHFD